jgi:Mg-chelatase subunit ChlD
MVLITDGVPTVDLNGNPNPNAGEQLARQAAAVANQRQIPIFTIGVAQNQTIQMKQDQFLSSSTPTGLAAISGNGAKYFSVTKATMNSSDGSVNAISAAFLQVARGLVQLLE